MNAETSEKIYFDSLDIYVSNTIIKSRNRVYNPSMINSVAFKQVPNPNSSKYANRITFLSLLLACAAFAFIFVAVYMFKYGISRLGGELALILLVFNILLAYFFNRTLTQKRGLEPYGWIGFVTSSGSTLELISTNYNEAQRIQSALEEMIRDKNK